MEENNNTYMRSLPDLGIQIRKWRLAKKLTQAELEQRAGLSHNTISRIECGSVSPRLQTLVQISQSLAISVEQLQFKEPPPTIGEKESGYGTDARVAKLISELEKIPEPKRGELIDTLLNVIEITKR